MNIIEQAKAAIAAHDRKLRELSVEVAKAADTIKKIREQL
jgi:hypothetical protein